MIKVSDAKNSDVFKITETKNEFITPKIVDMKVDRYENKVIKNVSIVTKIIIGSNNMLR